MRDLSSRFLTFRTLHVGFKIFTGRQADAFAVQSNGIKPNSSAMRQLTLQGAVSASSLSRNVMALSRLLPHISALGCKPAQTAGRSGEPKILQRCCSSSCTQRVLAGLPCGMPGIGDEIEGAVQQAPHWSRQNIMRSCRQFAATITVPDRECHAAATILHWLTCQFFAARVT